MLPEFRSFVRPIIRPFVRSFIVPIHRSSFVHSSYSSFIVRSYDYSPSLFTVTIHHYYSSLLFTDTIRHRYYPVLLFIIVTIHHRYYSSMISSNFFVVTIHRYYSSISRSPQISTTHTSWCPVHLRPARPVFQSYELHDYDFPSSGNFPSGHPSQVSPSWARLTLRFLWTRLPNSDSKNSCF
jgi:hypothetical protein